MGMCAPGGSAREKSAARLEGESTRIRVTRRSTRSRGMANSSSIQSGMAPPQGLAPAGLRSRRNVRAPAEASASAADAPAGPPPTTATRSVRADDDEEVVVAEQEMMMRAGE
uniref:Uncharacterized protein n=1 Tax=Zea mays TaxID=4577 RepID=C4J604_MAIZE|nr:unknown [Zea mays]